MRRPRLVCATCNGPVDEGRCAACRRLRVPESRDALVSPFLLLLAIAVLSLAWLVLVAHL